MKACARAMWQPYRVDSMSASCPSCGYTVVSPDSQRCPQCNAELSSKRAAAPAPMSQTVDLRETRLETLDDIRQWAAADEPTSAKDPASQTPVESDDKSDPKAVDKRAHKTVAKKVNPSGTKKATSADTTRAFRPTARPPILLLCIVDEGKDGGEWRRVRTDHVAIGRHEGDIQVPHDGGISTRHAELRRIAHNGRFRWLLRDLQSTNGTYVRAAAAPLENQQELVIGTTRLRFELGQPVGLEAQPVDLRTTLPWQTSAPQQPQQPVASLVELTKSGEGQRFALTRDEIWVGSDHDCGVVLSGDACISPRHARIIRNRHGRWQIENHHSLNGTWLRITEIPIDSTGEFLAGEQRFLVRVC